MENAPVSKARMIIALSILGTYLGSLIILALTS
jgi:hypothetical protein